MIGTLTKIERSGDSKTIWDSTKPAEVAAARTIFNELKEKNYLAYSVNNKGEKAEVVDEFDPNLERIILAPAMSGGSERKEEAHGDL